MKLRYIKTRNVLSFGDEGVELDFSHFNTIAGPNDSGKTNLFRALNIIEKGFEYGKPPLDGILYKGDKDRSLHLERTRRNREPRPRRLAASPPPGG